MEDAFPKSVIKLILTRSQPNQSPNNFITQLSSLIKFILFNKRYKYTRKKIKTKDISKPNNSIRFSYFNVIVIINNWRMEQ